METMASVYRLSPGRMLPSRSGEGLPTLTKIALSSLSYAGVVHTPPPPTFQASAYLALSAVSLALSAFSWAISGWMSLSSALGAQVPHQPLGALSSNVGSPLGAGMEYQRH